MSPGLGRTAARRFGWLLFAVLGGVVWGLCFARTPGGFVVWLALAPLPWLLSRPRAGWLCFAHGLAAWETSLWWVVSTLRHYGGLSWPLAVLLTTLLAAYLALYHALFGRLGAPLWRRWIAPTAGRAAGWWWGLLALPALWVALEWLRSYMISGFPWNLAAYAWIAVPGALPLAAFVGAYGLSFLAMWVAVGIAGAGARLVAHQTPAWRLLLAALALPLLLLPLAGRWSQRHSVIEARQAGQALPFRLLQPNIPNQVGFDLALALRDYRTLVGLSDAACEPGALVVWPESAGWPFEYQRDPLLDHELAGLVARGCSVLFNTDSPVPGSPQAYNSAYLLAPGAAAERYDKRHLVPFGEYVPLEKVLFFAKTVARNIGQFRPAERLTLLPWRGELLGPAICYEVVFPEETAALTQAGATILVTITNDGWYGDTAAPWQHLRAARFRAAENRRSMVRAAITGVSAVIAPDGSLRQELAVGQQGVLSAAVAGEREMTPYARWPWLPPLVATVMALVACLAVYTSRPRS